MVPIYSISSWVSMVSLIAAQFLDPVRDIYEAFTIYTFFQLLINYIHGERALIIMTHGRAPVHHLWPLNYVLPKVDISDPYTFLAIKRGILQYAWLKPILSLAAIIMKATGVYQEGYIGATSGYLWSGIIYNISVSVSLYSLGLFWVCMHQDLLPFRPMPKFLCIKLVIFASYWQGFFLSILVYVGAIPDTVEGYSSDNLAAAIQDALICCEMPIFAVAHWYAFSWHDFADNTISAARMPVKYAARDAFGIVDLIEDTKETFRGDKYNYRVFDSGGKVIAHEDSSSRFARLKQGMRYKRGGEAKYWIPRPEEVRGEVSANTPLLGSNGGPSGNGASNGSTPKYSTGDTDETSLDAGDEDLFDKARELEFGDWNVSISRPAKRQTTTLMTSQYPVVTANIPASERWIGHSSVFQNPSGAWNAAPEGRPLARTSSSTETLSKTLKKGKGKEKKKKSSTDVPSAGSAAPVPKSTAKKQEDTQKEGPLGAPVLTTSDPQILLEEAEDEEDDTFKIGEPTPDEESPEAPESRQWLEETNDSPHETSPLDGSGEDEEEFTNPWGK